MRAVAVSTTLDDGVRWIDWDLGVSPTMTLRMGQAVPGNVRIRSAQVELKATWNGVAEATASIGSFRAGRKVAQL
jgi:hypothetical protein